MAKKSYTDELGAILAQLANPEDKALLERTVGGEKTAEKTVEKTAEKTVETSSLPSTLADTLADTLAVKQTVKQTVKQSTEHSSRQSSKQSNRQSIEQSTKQSYEQSSQRDSQGSLLDGLDGYEKTSARWTKSESAVIGYFSAHKKVVITYDNLSIATGVAYGTLRMVIKKLESVGSLKRTRIGRHEGQAYEFLGVGGQSEHPSRQSCQQSNEQSCKQSSKQLGEHSSYMYVCMRRFLIHTQEWIDLRWEVLGREGLTPTSLEALLEATTSKGLEVDAVLGMLDMAEWEAENGGILDREGNPVKNPWFWVRGALIKTGFYRRPEGYKSGRELWEEDQLAEEKRIAAIREELEELRFSNWWNGLTDEQRTEIDKGRKFGPEIVWRKQKYKEAMKKGQELLPAPGVD